MTAPKALMMTTTPQHDSEHNTDDNVNTAQQLTLEEHYICHGLTLFYFRIVKGLMIPVDTEEVGSWRNATSTLIVTCPRNYSSFFLKKVAAKSIAIFIINIFLLCYYMTISVKKTRVNTNLSNLFILSLVYVTVISLSNQEPIHFVSHYV